LVPLLTSATCWAGLTPVGGPPRLGVQSVELPIALAEFGGPTLRVQFEHRDGTITARITDPGWLARLTADQQRVLGVGLGELAELCAAVWAADTHEAAPELAGWLAPRPWPERVAFWDAARTGPGASAG
ncbi:MAG: hypothetical protein ACRC7O_10425, partial [Fimbriiglobus sp.]